jgi:hypothetical protein
MGVRTRRHDISASLRVNAADKAAAGRRGPKCGTTGSAARGESERSECGDRKEGEAERLGYDGLDVRLLGCGQIGCGAAPLEQMGGKGVAQRMQRHALADSGRIGRLFLTGRCFVPLLAAALTACLKRSQRPGATRFRHSCSVLSRSLPEKIRSGGGVAEGPVLECKSITAFRPRGSPRTASGLRHRRFAGGDHNGQWYAVYCIVDA